MMAPSEIILWHNGQIMAFDSSGQQMPEWQGKWSEVLPSLLRVRWVGNIKVREWK